MKQLSKEGVDYWKQYTASIRKFRETAMKMLAHPDATPEQLWDVHTRLVSVMKEYNRLAPVVRECWPHYCTFVDL